MYCELQKFIADNVAVAMYNALTNRLCIAICNIVHTWFSFRAVSPYMPWTASIVSGMLSLFPYGPSIIVPIVRMDLARVGVNVRLKHVRDGAELVSLSIRHGHRDHTRGNCHHICTAADNVFFCWTVFAGPRTELPQPRVAAGTYPSTALGISLLQLTHVLVSRRDSAAKPWKMPIVRTGATRHW